MHSGKCMIIRHNSYKNSTAGSRCVRLPNLKVLLIDPSNKCISMYWYVNARCHYLVPIFRDSIRRKLLIDLPSPLQGLLSGDFASETAESRIGGSAFAMVAWFPSSLMGTAGSDLNLKILCLANGRARSLLEVSGPFSLRLIPKQPPILSSRFIGQLMVPNSMPRLFVLSCIETVGWSS